MECDDKMKSNFEDNMSDDKNPYIEFNVSWEEPTNEELIVEAVELENEQFKKQFEQQFKKLDTKTNNKVIDKYYLLEEAYLLCKECS